MHVVHDVVDADVHVAHWLEHAWQTVSDVAVHVAAVYWLVLHAEHGVHAGLFVLEQVPLKYCVPEHCADVVHGEHTRLTELEHAVVW